jgi:ssDNA-binding Zn-finger/Zn-ribbon topoisomerase 1
MSKKIKVKLEMTNCIKCGGEMPLLRLVKYGYKHCVNCSSVERVGGVAIANHKTGNEIQIMPMEDAERLYRLSQRSGYGVCKGMKHN